MQECDGGRIEGCNQDRCCVHPMEAKCQTGEAADCSKCAEFAPCLSSIDPRCISQSALDCLHCADTGLIDCASCAPGFDNNCITSEIFSKPSYSRLRAHLQTQRAKCAIVARCVFVSVLPLAAYIDQRWQSGREELMRGHIVINSCYSCLRAQATATPAHATPRT